ncbi:rsbT co-antagonist protein RsbR [Nannocystis exedens]|uniref:RsbT co-antagonist protein RsbR n=1 Tax=Nannocystis exedens TaxID=54 RepID=A0A1I2FEE0_9BACT|nr:STAS domain-containing protein [Nannocystis exedens]PCC70508.1 RsbT co-antagonist protein RsbRD [Nannocystis exedens]SFF03107.1 rsbT co-antagonist protein RsbR [Nannocystis exedens]
MSLTVSQARIQELLNVLVAAGSGDYDVRVRLEENDDALLDVEIGINYLLDDLVDRRDQNEAQEEELLTRARLLARQQEELVQALSTPVIAVWPGVLALPLVGRIDDARAATITAVLLERVAAERASHVILDLTGVAAIAGATMPALLRMVRAIGLLGAQCLLTGIRAEVAPQIVALGGADIHVRALAQLSDALALVLAEKGQLDLPST